MKSVDSSIFYLNYSSLCIKKGCAAKPRNVHGILWTTIEQTDFELGTESYARVTHR